MANKQRMQEIESKAVHTFVIADPHFFHTDIIKACGRPFNSVKEMNKILLNNWNQVVDDNDLVYVLGDYALKHQDKNKLLTLTHMLKGHKILVMGNHDTKTPKYYIELGFLEAVRKPILYAPNVVLMHEPPLEQNIIKGLIYIYGHLHNQTLPLDKYHNCRSVCVEKINYTPVDLNVLIEEINREQQ